jgi:DNA-directed RNA polymerase subunit H (RpoH/RPB5)
VNWRNAPAYKLSELSTQKIKHLAPLPYAFNIRNTTHLIQNLKETPMLPNYKFTSLDISNMYLNILITETEHILKNIIGHHLLDTHKKQEILTWYDISTKQIYLINNNNIIIQNNGLAIGAPTSSTLSEIFLQPTEHLHIKHLTPKHMIKNYVRYEMTFFSSPMIIILTYKLFYKILTLCT